MPRKHGETTLQQMLADGELREDELSYLRAMTHRLGTEGMRVIAETAFDEDGDPVE